MVDDGKRNLRSRNSVFEFRHFAGADEGGRRRLIDRLVKFFEEDVKPQEKNAPAGSREN